MRRTRRCTAVRSGGLLPGVLLLVLAGTNALAFDDGVAVPFEHPAWFKQSFYDLRDDLDEARAAGRHGVVLFFSTQGCAYCRRMLRTTFADPDFRSRISAAFDVIGLEMFGDSEITDWAGRTLRIKQFAVREGAEFSPTLVFYDTTGRRLLRLVGYYPAARLQLALDYLADPAGRSQGFRAWVAQRPRAAAETPSDAGGVAFTPPPYQLDRSRFAAERPLLALFDARRCRPCSEFRQQVLTEAMTAGRLDGFDVVHLDAADNSTPLVTPGGEVSTPAAWRAALELARLPALAWFDEDGRPVLVTDAVVGKTRFTHAQAYVRERAYARGWTFQRYARTQNLQRLSERDAQE